VIVSQQYPFEPIKYLRPTLRITFKEGIDMLRAAGFDAPYDEDISTPHEKALGKLVKEKFDTDFYIMDKVRVCEGEGRGATGRGLHAL
jgi:aspartyl-tRNA synthetase